MNQPPAAPLPPPPPIPPPPPTTPAAPAFDWRRLVAGNWVGAGVVALLTLLTAGLLGGVVALLVKPPDFGVGPTLDLATAVALGSFGVDLGFSGSVLGADVEGSAGVVPLTVTLAWAVVLVVSFRRVVRDYPRPGAAAGDAVRVALLVGLGLLVPALLFRGGNDRLGRGWGADLDDDALGATVDYGMHAAGAFFLGVLVVLVLLGLVLLVRRDWWPARVQGVLDWVAAPLVGYAVMGLLLPVVGLLGFLLLGFGEESLRDLEDETDLRELLTVVVVLLANGGAWVLGLGSGAAIGTHASGSGEPAQDDYEHLWGAVTDEEPGLWASPVLLLLVLAVAAVVVVRRSPTTRHAFGNLLVWAAGLLVVVPLLVAWSGAHGRFELTGTGDVGSDDFWSIQSFDVTGRVGLDGVQTTFFVVGIALLVAVAVAAATGTLDVGAIRERLATLQTTPGAAPPPPPPHQGPSGPPPSGPPPSGPPPSGPPPSDPPGEVERLERG